MDRVAHLRGLGVDGLAALLGRRHDVLVGRSPRSLSELADRLDSFPSVTAACAALNAAQLQVLVSVAALGGTATTFRLAELLYGDPRPQLADLEALALLDVRGDDVSMTPEVRRAVPDLLAVGHPFADLAAIHAHRTLQRAERALGLPRSTSKHEAVVALQAFYDDADRIRDHTARRLPEAAVVDLLNRAAEASVEVEVERYEYSYRAGVTPPWQRAEMLDEMGLATGLMIGTEAGWRGDVLMPSEVALALRGPGHRVRFDPEPPAVAWLPVSRVESDAASALAAFDSAATALLDHLAATPGTLLRAGGVGRREVQRLAKVTRTEGPTGALVLEVAAVAGLVDDGMVALTVTDEYRRWRDTEPAERVVPLLTAWWEFAGRPSDDRDETGAPRAVLTGAPCTGCRTARHAVVRSLRADVGLSLVDVRARAGWYAPTADLAEQAVESHWREAGALGAVAQGAVTTVGLALVADDREALLAAAAALLPESSTEAVFGSDLTVLVAGMPSSRVSAVLDACAVRESGGGAVTWRLSSASIRTALDAGLEPEALRSSLRGIAAGASLPGAVEVLLDDVARVYGRAVVRAASGVVVSDDAALLAQMLHDRKLAALGLHLVAPTVLVATADARTTTKTLRAAGYMPSWSEPPVPDLLDRPAVSWRRQAAEAATSHRADPAELARTLLAAGDRAPRAESLTEKIVRAGNRVLTGDEVAVLAAALDGRERVQIVYQSVSGRITERTVRPAALRADRIEAWCELRHDDREFLLASILGVQPV